jgi:hypothetical protein
MRRLWRNKWFILSLTIIILVPLILLVTLRIDYGGREDQVLRYFSQQAGMPEVFAELETRTPNDSIVLCWWDYGRAVRQWSHREVIEAYPSKDIWQSIGSSRDQFTVWKHRFSEPGGFLRRSMTSQGYSCCPKTSLCRL